jgi:hypothetical protein
MTRARRGTHDPRAAKIVFFRLHRGKARRTPWTDALDRNFVRVKRMDDENAALMLPEPAMVRVFREHASRAELRWWK